MRWSGVFKMAVVVGTALVVWLLLRDRTPRLVEPVRGPDSVQDALTGLVAYPYITFDRALWNDRSYHTFQQVRRLEGLHVVPIARNEHRPYVIEVLRPTRILTLANARDLRGVSDWKVLPDTLLVDDVVPERRFDLLLELELAPGSYRVLSPRGGPSKPVFFDPRDVRLHAQR